MDKDDSNGTSFEIIDKHAIEQANNGTKSGSTSLSTGNLLSNVGPPSSIPDFTLWTPSPSSSSAEVKPVSPPTTVAELSQVQSSTLNTNPANIPNIPLNTNPAIVMTAPILVNQFPTAQFSAAIPPSKGVPQEATCQPRSTQPLEAEAVAPSSFLGLVKGALSSQVVTKMVEKAKNSVDSIITTLDPQMSEYIYSGGDLEITVASEEEDIVSGVREAAHAVFGKAWVNGIKLGTAPQKFQAVGFESGLIIVEERIEYSLKFRRTPTVAIESILLKEANRWFDVSLLLLNDPERNINIHTFSQATPVPVEKFIDKEVADIDVELKLSEYLKALPCWQEEVSGLSRKEVIYLSARTLLKLYKDHLPKTQAKPT